MCKAEGMGIMPFGSLGGGKFKTREQRHAPNVRILQASEDEVRVSKVLEEIATRKNIAITSVALAYILHKSPYVFPVLGGRKVEHLKENIEALTVSLSPEIIKEIESAVPFELGFPHNMIWGSVLPENYQDTLLLGMGGKVDHVPEPQVSIN